MAAEGNGHDRIEREILVDAPIELVWRLVSEPGWWIGDGNRSHQIISHESLQDDLVVVEDPRYGRWSILPVSSQAPHHVSYRWPVVAGQPLEPATSTLVEFFLSEHGGGTRLRVVESGFASLAGPAEGRVASVEGKTAGWRQQLDIAKRDAERIRT